MRILPAAQPPGAYGLHILPALALSPGASGALAGCVWFAAGQRSPESGLRSSALHELGYVIQGALRIDTADGAHMARAGDMLLMSPAEPHSTTALEDSQIFFVLLDPTRAVG